MREVNTDLYKLLEETEVNGYMHYGSYKEAELVALINFCKLGQLADILGYSAFDDGGIDVVMMHGYIAIRIDQLIEEEFEHEVESYRDAIGEYEYKRYLEYKEMEI